MIAIVDLDMGNLRSVANAVASSGGESKWARSPSDLDEATHVILPGVGSFRKAADALDASGLRSALVEWAASGKPLLGICLGMQLLATHGDEGGGAAGLGLVPGRVVRFDDASVPAIPHVGWNEAKLRTKHALFERVKSGVDFYYVHSFHFMTSDPAHVLATVEYGGSEYVAAVQNANVVGTQFHPEKSQQNGLKVIESFCFWEPPRQVAA